MTIVTVPNQKVTKTSWEFPMKVGDVLRVVEPRNGVGPKVVVEYKIRSTLTPGVFYATATVRRTINKEIPSLVSARLEAEMVEKWKEDKERRDKERREREEERKARVLAYSKPRRRRSAFGEVLEEALKEK